MANWWKEYKKKNNIDQEANEARQKSSAAPQRTSSSGQRSYPYTPSDKTKAAAKSPTWWEDYKKSNDIYAESKAATERAKNLEKKLAQNKQSYDQYKAAQDQLAKNQRLDAAADRAYALTRNPWMSQADLETASFQRSADRYQRDLPLYQKSLTASTYSSGLHDQAYKQAQAAESAVKNQFQRYQQASQKAEADRNEKTLVNRPAQWQAENLSPQEIQRRLAYYRSDAATPTVTDKDREARAYLYPEAALQKDPHGARFDERLVEDAGQEAVDAAYRPILSEQEQEAVKQADQQILADKAQSNYEQVQILAAAQKLQGESYSRARGKQLIDEIAKGGEAANRVKTGKAMFEQQQARIAADTDVEIKDDLESSRGAYTASQKERQARGYILGYDWDNVPEEQKQAVYALFTQSPQQAIELAKYYIADARQAEDEERQAWYAQNALTAGVGLVASAGAHLAAAVDPFGEVGQELTRRGDNALTGGAQWADAATGYQKIPEWVPIVGGKGAGDLYQTVGSVVQSTAVAAPAILAGRYDKAAAEVVSKLGLVLMGSSTAASDYRESVAAGMDDDRAKLHALAAGVEEALFEEVSLDKLITMDTSGGFKSLVKNWLVQSGVEGSEELATGIANRITDELISGAGQSKVERRTSELIANGMSATQAKQQAESEWLTDTLYEGFSGFLSGGMMTGGNYALQGLANLKGRAVNAVETREAQRQAGAAISSTEGSVEALQAYAKDKGIEIKAVETAEQNAGESTEQGNQDGKQNSYSNRDYRSISDTNSKVLQSIRSEVRGKTVQEQQTIRDSLVEKYGEGIAPVVNNAISVETAARVRQEYGDVDSIQAARNQAVSEIKDESLRRAVSDGYDSAAYSLAASQGGEGGMDTMSRYIQQRRNTGSGSEMSMNATVTAQDGSTKTIAITGMSEDGKRVSLSDGSEVAVKDLQADEDTTSAIQQLADLDLGADATKVLQAYQQSGVSGTEGYRWLMDYATAYNQGRTRQISLEQATKRSSLDERTVMDAYTLGQQAANRETQAGLEKLKNLPKRKGASGRTANIDTTEIKGKTMSKSELEQFELANQYAQALGVDMTWFSSKEKDGKFIGKNGAYENGKIYMDIHAGRNFAADLTSGILATMGHELTHFQQQYAPEEYQALKEFFFEQIVKSSPNGEARLERLIWEKQKRSGYTLSRKAAEDEVVADACQKMLRDSKAVHEFANQQPEAANGIVHWLDKWFKKVRSIFERGGNYSEEAQIMDSLEQDVKAAFGELWDKALKQAVKVHDEVGDMESEREGQNSDRDYNQTVVLTERTVDKYLADYAAKSSPNYAQAYIVRMSPNQFLDLTTSKIGRNRIYSETGEMDVEKLKKASTQQPFQLRIDSQTGQVEGHEGRHRAMALSNNGITSIPVLLFDSSNKYNKTAMESLELHGQDFGTSRSFATVTVQNVQPLSYANRDNVVQKFTTQPSRERIREKYGNTETIRYSDRDAEYLELAKDPEKNEAKLQEMVDEAARRAGYIYRRNTRRKLSAMNSARAGIRMFVEGNDELEHYGRYRYAATGFGAIRATDIMDDLLQLVTDYYEENGMDHDGITEEWVNPSDIVISAQMWDDEDFVSYAWDNYFERIYDETDKIPAIVTDDGLIVFGDDNARIKSLDPVTYDDDGNVIPLSERFNEANEDIRYSERDELASDNHVHDLTNRSGETVGVQDGNGHAVYSERTYEKGGREAMESYLRKQVEEKHIDQTDMDQILASVDEIYKYSTETADKHYREWATAEVKRNILGKPVYSWAKDNSEYGKSLDASLICIKRRTLDAVFDYMIQNGMFDNFDLGQQSIVAINDIIRSHGFEIACGLCYIDAKRYRAAMVAGQFADLYNDLVKSMLPEGMAIEEIGYFNYGKNSAEIYQTKGPGLANIPSEHLNFSKIDEVLKTHKPKSRRSSGDVEYRVAKALKSDPSMRKLVSASDFMSKTGFENVGKENAALLKLYNAKKGTGGPKATEGDTQYLHEILASSSFDGDKYFRVGGLRVQSFSDYIPRLVMDYAEMIGDMAAKKLPSHAYSKELMFALQFGLSGMKINMSLIPAMVDGGVAPGLDANGNYAWRDGQSFGSTVYGINKSQSEFLAKVLGEKVDGRLTAEQGFRLAKLIQSAEGYRDNCGTIAIGVSNKQVWKMLEDEDIRMIIPYHRSGLNHILASLMNVKGFTDYTAQQNTLRWNGEAWVKLAKSQKDFNFNEYMYTHKCDARTAARAYIQWCEKKGYKPKFSGYSAKFAEYDASSDFTKSDNYYKVLEDFNSYDAVNGQALPQKAVQAVFPNDQSAFGSMKELMAMAIDGEALQRARQDKTVPEIVKEIQKTLPALEQTMREARNDDEKIQAYEEWRDRNGYGEQMQFSERDYSTSSDEELLMNARVEDATSENMRQLLTEYQARRREVEKMEAKLSRLKEERNAWREKSRHGGKYAQGLIDSKNRDIAKLKKQIHKYRDIMAGKANSPELAKMLKAEREKAEARVKEQKEQVFQNYKERKKATDLRGRIKNLSDEMKRRMTNPTDRAYVPASLYQSMTKLADALDNVLSPNPGTKAEARYRAMMDAIHGMAREYEDVKNLDPVFASEYEQEISDAIGEIERILERRNASWIDNLTGDTQKGLAELNSNELQQLYDLMRQINYTITNATKVFGNSNYKSILDAQRAVAEQQNNMKGLNMVSRIERKKRLRLLNSLSVMRATEMMAGWDRSAALYQLMHGIEQGADDAWAWVMDYNKSMQDLKTGKNEKEYRQALTKQLDFGITDRDGLKVTMTKMQALQILMTAEREEHNDKLLHLQAGGAVIRNAIDLQNGKGAKARSQTISVTPELIQKIRDSLTEWDKAYMKTVRDYFKLEGKRTNEILYKLKHKVLKTEEFYVPYTVDRNYLEANLNEQQALNMWVKTPGSTNTLKQKAKQPVIIDGMDTVMGQHVKEIGNYIGMAIPIRDFSKVYNGMIPTEGPNPLPVKETIERTFGKAGQHLLTQAVIDVQGGTARQNWESNIAQFLNKLQGAFVRSALLINPSVTIKQAASYIAAESVISHLALERGNHPVWARTDESKSFMPGGLIAQLFARPEGKTAQRIYNEIDQHTSLHYQRRQGMSMAEIAEQANRTGPIKRRINAIGASMEQSRIGHAVRRTGENLNPITWIQRMDVATTAALWVACKEQAKLDKLAVGSEEFWKRTTELYERCIRETQPMYDGLHRTANQKQSGGLMQYLFPFRTVPIQNHGQLAASYEAYKAARESKNEAKIKEAGKFFRKTAWAQTESAFVFSVMTFLAATLKRKTKKYRDEEGEFGAGSFTKGLLTDVGSTLISVLNPMYGSELFNLGSRAVDKFEGNSGYTYDAFSVGVVDMINDLASSGDRLLADAGKIVRGEDVNASDFWDHAMNFLVKGGKLAGIPADTVKTYFEGTKGNIQDAIEGRIPALNDESWERDAATNVRRYLKAYLNNDTKKAGAVLAELRSNLSKSGKSEAKINEAIRKYVSAQAVEKVADGTWTEEEAEAYLLSTGAYDDREDPQKDAWNAIRKGVAKSTSTDEEFKWNQYDDLAEVVANGEDVTGLLTEYRNHGYTETQINGALRDSIQEAMASGDLNEDEAADALIRYGVTYSKDGQTVVYDKQSAWKKVQEWADKAEHTDEEGGPEDGYKYSAYNDLFEAVDANQDAEKVIKEMVQNGGYEADSLRGQIKEHLRERFIAGEITETALKNQLSRYCKIVNTKDVNEIVANAKCKRDFGAYPDDLKEAFKDGDLSQNQAVKALQQYKGLSKTDAQNRVQYWGYDGDLSENAWLKWNKELKSSGLTVENWEKVSKVKGDAKGIDANGDGRADSGTVKDEVVSYIDSMDIPKSQKKAIYLAFGWAASTMPSWH